MIQQKPVSTSFSWKKEPKHNLPQKPADKSPPSPGFPDHLLLPQAGDFLHGFPVGRGDPTERDVPRGAVEPKESEKRCLCFMCFMSDD